MNRRGFVKAIFASVAAAAAASEIDPERLLYVPGAKTFFLPPARPVELAKPIVLADDLPSIALQRIDPGPLSVAEYAAMEAIQAAASGRYRTATNHEGQPYGKRYTMTVRMSEERARALAQSGLPPLPDTNVRILVDGQRGRIAGADLKALQDRLKGALLLRG